MKKKITDGLSEKEEEGNQTRSADIRFRASTVKDENGSRHISNIKTVVIGHIVEFFR